MRRSRAALLLVFGKLLLSLFGAEFSEGYPLLFLLVIGILARASLGPVETLLTMAHLQNHAAAVYGATLALNIVLCFVLIPIYGPVGAAAGTAISMVFESVSLYWVTRKHMRLHVFIFGHPHID